MVKNVVGAFSLSGAGSAVNQSQLNKVELGKLLVGMI
jgi:hypothetical protein